MDLTAKIKAVLIALLAAIFAGLPLHLALATASLAAIANLLGIFAALRQRERVSGFKIALGLLRITLYLILIPLLFYIGSAVGLDFMAKFVTGSFAAYESMLLLEKAYEIGIIPKRVVDRILGAIERAIEKLFGHGSGS